MKLKLELDRYWLITWCTYGSWLPGDPRGFVGPVRDGSGAQVIHNIPGTPYDNDLPSLQYYAKSLLKGDPILLNQTQAERLWLQFQETTQYRGWQLFTVAIMAVHVHLVVGVPGDPDPAKILGDYKSYASRALNRQWGKPPSDTWWVDSGSKRKLPNRQAVLAAIKYVVDQNNPLLLWTESVPELNLPGGRIAPGPK